MSVRDCTEPATSQPAVQRLFCQIKLREVTPLLTSQSRLMCEQTVNVTRETFKMTACKIE